MRSAELVPLSGLQGDFNGYGDVEDAGFQICQRDLPSSPVLFSMPEQNALVILALGSLLVLYRCGHFV